MENFYNIDIRAIFLVICFLIGIVICFFYKGIFHKIITFCLALPILLANIINVIDIGGEKSFLIIACFFCIAPSAILTIIYGFKELKHNKLKQISVICAGFWLFINYIFKILHWPFANYIIIAIILSFIAYIISLFIDKKHFTKEISFMIVWLSYTFNLLFIIYIRYSFT